MREYFESYKCFKLIFKSKILLLLLLIGSLYMGLYFELLRCYLNFFICRSFSCEVE